MELVEIMVHSSYTAVYAHIIVVQDDENVVRGRRSIVQSFESQTATHRTVADDGNDVPSFFILMAEATAMPKAAEMELEACPQVNVSYSLSEGEGKGFSPCSFLLVEKRSLRPVSILWPYA